MGAVAAGGALDRLRARWMAALALVDRYRRGEPRLAFGTALVAYCFTLLRGSVFTLAWLVSAGAIVAKWAHAEGHTEKIAPHAAKLQAYLTGLAASIEVPPALKELLVTAKECAPATVGYAPLGGVFLWAFYLGWYHKALVLGMGALGYRAWASPEDVASQVESVASSQIAANIKKGARRMTMGAGELVRMAGELGSKTPKAKEN